MNRELLNRKAKIASVPPLKTDDGKWLLDAKEKADEFASAFSKKCELPEGPEVQFVAKPEHLQKTFTALRVRSTLDILKSLNVSIPQATIESQPEFSKN